TQAAISGSPGVSATSLAGLSMAATWADNNTAVTFNSPRTLALTTGTNNIRLGFRPRLNTSVSPTGNFSSQYTLNITYL
ncbi:MAG: fimbrial protein, partial [Pseudomonas sp.]|nr:fimbrial protein [Pseudomonas sp.]